MTDDSSLPQLPRNIAAEVAFLGAVLVDNRVLEELPVALTEFHFFEVLHGRIFRQIRDLADKNQLANAVTLKPYFENDEAMQELGGTAYLATLTEGGVSGLIGARDMARQIHELALLRQLVTVGRNMADNALDTSEHIDPMIQIEEAETALYQVAGGDAELGAVLSFGAASKQALDNAEKALGSGGHVSGITTGFSNIDNKIGGLHNSDLVIIAGRPAMGKTALATNIAFNAARRYQDDVKRGLEADKNIGARVAFFSLEMAADQLANRVLAEQANIRSDNLRTGRVSKSDFQNLVRATQELNDLPLFIDDTPGLTIAGLRTRARRLARRRNIGLIVIDYLQLLQGKKSNYENRVTEIGEISRGLKQLAKELNIPVLALSQLNRGVEQREDKRPLLSDLRESGSIEQDADMVLFLFREEYYIAAREPKQPAANDDDKTHDLHQAWLQEMERAAGVAELIIAKQRHGATGKIMLHFAAENTKFTDLAYDNMASDYD